MTYTLTGYVLNVPNILQLICCRPQFRQKPCWASCLTSSSSFTKCFCLPMSTCVFPVYQSRTEKALPCTHGYMYVYIYIQFLQFVFKIYAKGVWNVHGHFTSFTHWSRYNNFMSDKFIFMASSFAKMIMATLLMVGIHVISSLMIKMYGNIDNSICCW